MVSDAAMPDDAKPAWVRRVLGVSIAASPAQDAAGADADAQAIWRAAKDAVDERLNQLAGHLRRTGDPDLIRIADLGLFSIGGGGSNVALNKALFEFNRSPPERRPAAAELLRKAATGYRSALASNEGVRLVDNNPFGVSVELRASLTAALDRIEQSLP